MTADRKPLHPLAATGFICLAAGITAWAWTGDWRWVVTGLCALLVFGVVGAALDARRNR